MMRVSQQIISIKRALSKCSSLGQPHKLNPSGLKNPPDNQSLKAKIILPMLQEIV
jgi:hypothetical protein